MEYTYSKLNRLEIPHNYMYTPFQGAEFLRSYKASRIDIMGRQTVEGNDGVQHDSALLAYSLPILEDYLSELSFESSKQFRTLLRDSGMVSNNQCEGNEVDLEGMLMGIEDMTTGGRVLTVKLLQSLISAQLVDASNSQTKVFLGHLVQRFEVSKKIYESYAPDLRKGQGDNRSIRLYWLFSLALCLFYTKSNEIKYLNTLLKVCDLLCSLPENILRENIPQYGLPVVLAVEVISVQYLSEKIGLTFAAE